MPAEYSNPSPAASPAGVQKNRRRGKRSFTLRHFVLLVVVAGAALLVMTNSVDEFVRYIYNPFAVLILLVIAGMYIFQESADRSRMYRLELREMRRHRVEDLQFYRKAQEELESVAAQLKKLKVDDPSRETLEAARKDLVETLERMRERTG